MKPGMSQKLRTMREHAGLTQQQLADATGISPRSITNYEKPEGWPICAYSLDRLADYYGISIADLVDVDCKQPGSSHSNNILVDADRVVAILREHTHMFANIYWLSTHPGEEIPEIDVIITGDAVTPKDACFAAAVITIVHSSREQQVSLTQEALQTLQYIADLVDNVHNTDRYSLTKDDILCLLQKLHPDDHELKENRSKAHDRNQYIADIVSSMLLDKSSLTNTILRDLRRFLLYLPLVGILDLRDFLWRIQGNLHTRGEEYLQCQLQILYDSIAESPAKRYADSISYYGLSCPSVYNISEAKAGLAPQKLLEYKDWVVSPNTKADCAAYKQAIHTLITRLDTLQQLESTQKHTPADCEFRPYIDIAR